MDPHQARVDVERVLQFLVNRLQVRGKIGVYGRSIGGICAAHLVQKFPKIIKAFIGDRTMGSIDNVALRRFKGGKTFFPYYRLFTCIFKLNNGSRQFIENTSCYKIHCFDRDDDVVDVYSSHHHEVAKNYSRIKYRTIDFRQFYNSLTFIFEIERELFNHEFIKQNSRKMDEKMLQNMDMAEGRLNANGILHPLSVDEEQMSESIFEYLSRG